MPSNAYSFPVFPEELTKGMTGVELIDSAFRLLFYSEGGFYYVSYNFSQSEVVLEA